MSKSNAEGGTQSGFPASDKERFDFCLAMLKAYYDALENRAGSSVAGFVVIIGWLITSEGARQALANERRFGLALATLTLVLVLYGLNVARWVRRWREIRGYIDDLGYVEPRFYARYELPKWTWLAYFMPVALLYVFIIAFLILIR